MKLTFREFIELLFLPVLTAGVFVLWDLNKNVNNLNVQVGVVIAYNSAQKERTDTLERRIERLEDERKRQSSQHER